MNKKKLYRAVITSFFMFSSVAIATPVLDFTGGNPLFGGNQNVGWQFNVVSDITVTHLTWADLELDGLNFSHEVGIWAADGTLLTSTTIGSGTSEILVGLWRTVDIADIILSAGTGYIVGGHTTGSEAFASNVSTLTVNPAISFVDATFSGFTSNFERPAFFSSADTGFFGPSFNVSSATVPEPVTLTLLGLGLAGIGFGRRAKTSD